MPIKKKKPAKNPARGFATTSTASKSKPLDNEKDNITYDPVTDDEGIKRSDERLNDVGTNHHKQEDMPLSELSPEELEKQLEESSLQLFIDSYGTRVQKDVSRHLSRLQTERRLLRNQASPLSTHQWLPKEMTQLMVDNFRTQIMESDSGTTNTDSHHSGKWSPEDDLLAKFWSLRQLLIQLGFSLGIVHLALRNLVATRDKTDQRNQLVTKDSLWGLDECLSWLAFAIESEGLPSFQTLQTQNPSKRGRKMKIPRDVENSGNNHFSYFHYFVNRCHWLTG